MAVTSQDLDNPERDLGLATREPGKAPEGELDTAAAELKVLRERIAAAAANKPKDTQPHCGDCFSRGWRAALRAIGE